jgi:hypothetical protein
MFAALALSAALGLSACGDAGTESGSATPASASAPGLKAGATVDGADLATRMTDAMVKAGSGGIVMDLGEAGRANGWFVFQDGELQQQMRMTLQGQPLQVVTTGGVVYIQGIPGSSKPWVKIDPKADDPMSKAFAGATGDMGDPRRLAKALDGTKATVVSASADATVYDVTIDPSKLLGGAGQTAAPSVGPVTARYTLDQKDRPTTMVVKVAGETITITFADWGEPTDVVAPPADQVGTFELPKG